MTDQIAVAFPVAHGPRKFLRKLASQPLGIIVPGSEVRECKECGIRLAVGPRVLAAVEAGKCTLLCLLCMIEVTGGELFEITDLGNPDSRPETPNDKKL